MHYKKYKSILSAQNGMNLYRGCTHGCVYCDSRSLCYRMEHDFEDIEIKQDAAEMLEAELGRKRKKCMVGTGSMCDPYMPVERELNLTRRCLEIIYKYGFGLTIQTKSTLILRDIDLLAAIHERTKCVVQITLTTFDEGLCKILEPNVSTTRERFDALTAFRERGIPTVVWMTPILPFINDTEENIRGLMDYCVRAGVRGLLHFGLGVTLRDGDREYFYAALDRHFPGVKQKYIARYGGAYSCKPDNGDRLMNIVYEAADRHGIMVDEDEVFAYMHSMEKDGGPQQMTFI